jgi:hypothetical protein
MTDRLLDCMTAWLNDLVAEWLDCLMTASLRD